MTEEMLIQKLSEILDKDEMQVKQTPYVTLLRLMVESYECLDARPWGEENEAIHHG